MNPLSQWFAANGGLVGLGVELAKWSLILFSILSLAIIVERALTLRRIREAERSQFSDTRDFLRTSQLFEGNAPCQKIAAVGWEQRANPTRMREAIERETTMQIAALSFNLPILATAASTAPYIGLFGTVLGILSAFRQIAASGQTGAAVIAGGISEALTATALGLGVAIPAVLAYNYFAGRVNALALEIETHAEELAATLDSTRPQDQGVQGQGAGDRRGATAVAGQGNQGNRAAAQTPSGERRVVSRRSVELDAAELEAVIGPLRSRATEVNSDAPNNQGQ